MAAARAPHVVIVGGYLTEPLFYRPLRSRLLRRGAASVTLTPLHWPDWLGVTFMGMGPAMLRVARTIRQTRNRTGAPVLVIAHSAGGILSRLAMCPEPIDGRIAQVQTDIGALVTLGSPHRMYPDVGWHHPGVRAAELVEQVTPGAFHAPTTGYLTVGSTLTKPARRAPTNTLKQVINRTMRVFVGRSGLDARGDGIVDNEMSQLAGVQHIALPDALHGTFGAPWYGDGHIIDRWWPAAVEVWSDALEARERVRQESQA